MKVLVCYMLSPFGGEAISVSLDDVTCFATSSVSRTDDGSSYFELSVDISIVKRSRGLLGNVGKEINRG